MGQRLTKLCGSKTDTEQNSPVKLASGNVHHITTVQNWEEKLSEASRDGKIVVANFSASWCSPCRVIAPPYCELADRYSSFIFLTVDVDVLPASSSPELFMNEAIRKMESIVMKSLGKLEEFSTSWGIEATPTFFFLKDGRQVDKLVGANQEELQKKLAAIADSATRS